MTWSAESSEGCTVLIYGFLPWLCWLLMLNEATALRDATQSVVMHFVARAMLSSRALGRFRARIVREARAYGMKCVYGCMK